jgi:hypothetical protein
VQSRLSSITVGRSAPFSSSKPYYKVSFLLEKPKRQQLLLKARERTRERLLEGQRTN